MTFVFALFIGFSQQGAVSADPAEVMNTNIESTDVISGSGQGDKKELPKQTPGFDPNAPASPDSIPSLLFTYWQHESIMDAKKTRGSARPPTQAELNAMSDEEKVKPPPEERELRLGGIVYVSKKEWTVWLNGKRVTPSAIPKEVLSLSVHKEYIEIKWLDEYTNSIFPVRLRTNQKFNMDTRIFLPG
jgi:hypothetical protein